MLYLTLAVQEKPPQNRVWASVGTRGLKRRGVSSLHAQMRVSSFTRFGVVRASPQAFKWSFWVEVIFSKGIDKEGTEIIR